MSRFIAVLAAQRTATFEASEPSMATTTMFSLFICVQPFGQGEPHPTTSLPIYAQLHQLVITPKGVIIDARPFHPTSPNCTFSAVPP